jgi:hypothetical protein
LTQSRIDFPTSGAASEATAQNANGFQSRHSTQKERKEMRRIVTKLVVGMAITAIGVFAADSSAATWKFNAAKSKSTSTNPIKSQTDIRETTPDGGVKVTRTGQFTDGTPNAGTYSYNYDGKESSVAATGLPFDKISVKRVDANTTSWEVKKTGGKYHATGQNVISKDGKTLTQTAKGTSAEGKPEESTNVFDKQ